MRRILPGLIACGILFSGALPLYAVDDDVAKSPPAESVLRERDIRKQRRLLHCENPVFAAHAVEKLRAYGSEVLDDMKDEMPKIQNSEITTVMEKAIQELQTQALRGKIEADLKALLPKLKGSAFDEGIDNRAYKIRAHLEEIAKQYKVTREDVRKVLSGIDANLADGVKQLWDLEENPYSMGGGSIIIIGGNAKAANIVTTKVISGSFLTFERSEGKFCLTLLRKGQRRGEIFEASDFQSFSDKYPDLVKEFNIRERDWGSLDELPIRRR